MAALDLIIIVVCLVWCCLGLQVDVCKTVSTTLSVSLAPGLTQPSAIVPSASRPHAADAGTTTSPVAVPPVDVSHLPPGYFVLVEMPPADVDHAGHDQALYHIFAVDEGVEPASSATTGSRGSQQHAAPSDGDALRRSATGSQSESMAVGARARAATNGNLVQLTDPMSVVCNEPVRAPAARAVHWHTGGVRQQPLRASVASPAQWHGGTVSRRGGAASVSEDIAQLCDDDYELTATKQADGTVVIQTTPTVRRAPAGAAAPRPRGAPAGAAAPWPRVVPPLHTSVPAASGAQQMTMSTRPCAAEILLGAANSGKTHRDDDADAQYVDIVVEDCDDFEREECVV